MKKTILLSLFLGGTLATQADTLNVSRFQYAGPYAVARPYQVDKTDVMSKAYDAASLLDCSVSTEQLKASSWVNLQNVPAQTTESALNLASFVVENTRYGKAKFVVEGVSSYRLSVDGETVDSEDICLSPATHTVVLKYLTSKTKKEVPSVKVESEEEGVFKLREDGKSFFTLDHVLHGQRIAGTSISPNGKYLIVNYRTTLVGGESRGEVRILELASGKVVASRKESVQWMPRSNRYYFTREGLEGRELVTVDPLSGIEQVLANQLPEGSFTVAPSEDYLMYYQVQEGPKERKEIYQILEPDDRQPGWRNRMYLAYYDLKSGVYQPLTFGYRNHYMTDISSDGRYVLFMVNSQRLIKRPTTLFSLYRLDMHTKQVEPLVENDGFIAEAVFSPDGKKVLVKGSPEAFDGVGQHVEEGQIPSMYDYQLYSLDIASKKVTPLTRDFDPSVQRIAWNEYDNMVYFTAEKKDSVSLFRMDVEKKTIRLLDVPEEIISSFSLASQAGKLAFYGESASNWQRLYTFDTKKQKSTVVDNLSEKLLADVELGTCESWNFVNSRGDTIVGRFYLPPHFDAGRKYPMIVNYYGGCTPTSRNFATRYPHHAYAALGYVVYVIEPSGASGFGQKFSARHVNTWGDYVADDIIEGTKQFTKEHSFVDADKIGCIGASYGGFMTQYLQTKTDIFAAAISHAGISSIASYWGEGYWGYSYGEVASAHSYPWNESELYTKHSPLFNADKVHTPLLFLHGSVDTNVPVGESIQMFNALKLLGRETAFVVVDKQDHHIMDYHKRQLWQDTIFAWFAKWLQGDDSWWNALYVPKNL